MKSSKFSPGAYVVAGTTIGRCRGKKLLVTHREIRKKNDLENDSGCLPATRTHKYVAQASYNELGDYYDDENGWSTISLEVTSVLLLLRKGR